MVYSSEVVLPTKLRYWSPRVEAYQSDEAKRARWDAINLLEESRDVTIARSTKYQQMLRQYHALRFTPGPSR
jgi:hypothetical protein